MNIWEAVGVLSKPHPMSTKRELPSELVNLILEYSGDYKWRSGKYMKQLAKDDPRKAVLMKKPLVRKAWRSGPENLGGSPYHVRIINPTLAFIQIGDSYTSGCILHFMFCIVTDTYYAWCHTSIFKYTEDSFTVRNRKYIPAGCIVDESSEYNIPSSRRTVIMHKIS